jgi:hypothetical protein
VATVHHNLRRSLARQAGLTSKALAAQVRISFAKVAEYQRRGIVHFHAIIRLDGPAGPITAPPAWATVALLTAAIDQAARTVRLETPAVPGLPARTLAWGREIDTRPVTTTGELTDNKVAAYVAKYATKAAECTGTLDRRISPADQDCIATHRAAVTTDEYALGACPCGHVLCEERQDVRRNADGATARFGLGICEHGGGRIRQQRMLVAGGQAGVVQVEPGGHGTAVGVQAGVFHPGRHRLMQRALEPGPSR